MKKNTAQPKQIRPMKSLSDIPHGFSVQSLEYRVISDPDSWLTVAYEILATEFDASTLDPFERYVEWLEMNRAGTHPFPFLMLVAYFQHGSTVYVAGVISGNIMKIIDYDKADPSMNPSSFIYAIGHQVTTAGIREKSIKGVGTGLIQMATQVAQKWITEQKGIFLYSVLEAEQDSAGFWSKIGFRWPQGIRYWQPPLQFHATGDYKLPEVPEILMVKPSPGIAENHINRSLLRNIIATIYLNWSLHKYRNELSETAMARAEKYVMKDLLGRVDKKMPRDTQLKLVPISIEKGLGQGKHFRSVALHTGLEHGFEPLTSPRLEQFTDFDEMLGVMKNMAFGARTLGQAADVLYAMATDSQCKIIVTLAGAVTVAKLDLILAEMIERGLIHCIVSTGAILCHGFNAERGSHHFKVPNDVSDTWLFEQGYNRIYDTIETEYVLDELQEILHEILKNHPSDQPLCSSDLIKLMGRYLIDSGAKNGLLQAAYKKEVPIFIPAFTDSEIGLDFALFNYYQKQSDLPIRRFDPFLDFEQYCEFMIGAPVRGILTLGGGVPRNWAQQIGPFLDAIERSNNAVAVKSARFKYGLRICPDPPFWGGLSGCTYSEGISWGKFIPPEEGGQFAEVLSDFTFVFPVLVKGLFQRMEKKRKV